MNAVQMAWAIMPADCKISITRIERLGLKEKAKDWLLAEAEAGLRRCGNFSTINHLHALELAAEKWLEKEGL